MPRSRPNPTPGYADPTTYTYADPFPYDLGYGPDDRPHYRHAPRASRI